MSAKRNLCLCLHNPKRMHIRGIHTGFYKPVKGFPLETAGMAQTRPAAARAWTQRHREKLLQTTYTSRNETCISEESDFEK